MVELKGGSMNESSYGLRVMGFGLPAVVNFPYLVTKNSSKKLSLPLQLFIINEIIIISDS
jgi:hypothetical protein